MQIPLQITFKDMEHSDSIEANVTEKAQKLEQFSKEIISCRVVIEEPHKNHQQGNLFKIKIDVTVPGYEIVASKQSDQNHAHEDVYVAIRDAFDAVRRQLQDFVLKQRGEVKEHQTAPHGIIKELFPEMDYGIIETIDDREIYFHRNSLTNVDFDHIKVGDSAQFTEEMGDKGPQASSVHIG
ncbi:MAG: ribosome-associated translation inhibitor RaiA [Pseudomonadota bacterium]|nr:ribosome-associated translation inhibitor RaiA [Pseudomonadota bacterium]